LWVVQLVEKWVDGTVGKKGPPRAVLMGNEVKESSVGDVILSELEQIESSIKTEKELFSSPQENLTEKEKSRRLLFLFQKDLMPGINGMILESKDKREDIRMKARSFPTKIAAWIVLAAVNVGMLFYILLFALSQDGHHQRAWGQSFAIWLVTDMILVSTATVLVFNVFIPAWTMKDVGMIKKKLVTNVINFYKEAAAKEKQNQKRKTNLKDVDEDDPDNKNKKLFNSAEYFFLSNRMASFYSELKIAKMILSFQTPWPKQSYQHLSQDVSQVYAMKFSTVQRSLSIVVLFFLTSFLSVPISVQDMIVHIASTATIGYTFLLHLQLYQIFPVLVIIPTIFLGVVIHFIIKANRSKRQQEETKLLNEIRKEHVQDYNDFDDIQKLRNEDDDEENNQKLRSLEESKDLEAKQQAHQHKDRRRSIQQGVSILKKAEDYLNKRRSNTFQLPEFSFSSFSEEEMSHDYELTNSSHSHLTLSDNKIPSSSSQGQGNHKNEGDNNEEESSGNGSISNEEEDDDDNSSSDEHEDEVEEEECLLFNLHLEKRSHSRDSSASVRNNEKSQNEEESKHEQNSSAIINGVRASLLLQPRKVDANMSEYFSSFQRASDNNNNINNKNEMEDEDSDFDHDLSISSHEKDDSKQEQKEQIQISLPTNIERHGILLQPRNNTDSKVFDYFNSFERAAPMENNHKDDDVEENEYSFSDDDEEEEEDDDLDSDQ
jgi:uncharacterized membrane protein